MADNTTATTIVVVDQNRVAKIGVLALQGAFAEHEKCLRAIGCTTVQVRTPRDLEGIDGIILPGGESTAMGLIGSTATRCRSAAQSSSLSSSTSTLVAAGTSNHNDKAGVATMWDALIEFAAVQKKPVWGTCAGMILLSERCIGTSAVIANGQALIGGMDMTVCRNYFGAQISSFEMPTPAPPLPSLPSRLPTSTLSMSSNTEDQTRPFPGVFIRAPAILSVGSGIDILGTVTAIPCRQAALTLAELERKIAAGENVLQTPHHLTTTTATTTTNQMVDNDNDDDHDDLSRTNNAGSGCGETCAPPTTASTMNGDDITTTTNTNNTAPTTTTTIVLPGAAPGSLARNVICAARRDNLLCTAFHPELTDDYRWHAYFVNTMVQQQQQQ